MNFLKKRIRKLIYGEDATSEDLTNYLTSRGATIGKGFKVYAPNKTLIDKTAPFLLTFGDYVRVAEGVKILTHDYSWCVLKRYSSDTCTEGQVLGSQAPVHIGNNVFIGMNSVITCGVTVGDNVIIGAGSVVTKDCERDSVYAGVPAKRLMSIEEFFAKRKAVQLKEAKAIAVEYKKKFGVTPPPEVMAEYFMLFCDGRSAADNKAFTNQMNTSGNYSATASFLSACEPTFKDYSDFLEHCFSGSGDMQ